MEFAGSAFEIKELHTSGHIEGMLAGFGNIDHGGDKLLPGCLTKSLQARITPLPMLLCHDPKRPIGAWLEWADTADGLHVKGRITLGSRDGQEAYALAKDGALTGLSIGWKGGRGTYDGAGTRLIAEADLVEGSLVPCPMNDRTRVTAVKSINGARDLEDMLRGAGFSGRKSKHAASEAWKALQSTETDEADLAELAALIGNATARLNAIGGK
jgi:HK97 family phage prohead protease